MKAVGQAGGRPPPPSWAPTLPRQTGPRVGLAAAFAASVLVGLWIVRDPSFVHMEVALAPGTLIPLALVLGLAAVILRVPAAGLILLVVAVYLNLSQVLVRHHGFPSVLQLFAVPLFLAGLLEWGRSRVAPGRAQARGHHLVLALLALHAVTVLLSTTVADDRGLADQRLVELLKGLAIAALLVLLLTSRSRARAVTWALLGGGAFLAGLAVVQAVTGSYASDFGGLARIKHAHIHGTVFQPRIAGPLGDPNYFAQILLVLVPIALFTGWNEARARVKLLAFAMGGVIVAATVLTYSRGGALALGFVLLLSFLVHGLNLRRLAVGLVALLALGFLLPQDFTSRLATVTEILPGEEEDVLPQDSSFQERLLLGGVALEMFRDRPVLGVGAGNYTVHFDEYVDRVGSAARDYGGTDAARYPHNLFLELGAEGGIVALLSFLAVMAATLVLLHRARRRFLAAGDPLLAGLAAAVAIALTGYLVSSLFLHGHFQRYLWLLVGLGAALYAISIPRGGRETDSPSSPPSARTAP